MSDRAILYRCAWGKNYRGVYVETYQTYADAPEAGWVWHESMDAAMEAESKRMFWLSGELSRVASYVTRDIRSTEG